jgi:hypothetical protein
MAISETTIFGTSLFSGTGGGNPSDALSRLFNVGGFAALFDDFGTVLNGSPTELALGDLGDGSGFRLYFGMNVISGGTGVETGIYSADPTAARTTLITQTSTPELNGVPLGLVFGQGDAFGQSLYAGISSGRVLRIDGSTSVSTFVDGLHSANSVAISPQAPDVLYLLDVDSGADEATLYRVVAVQPVPSNVNPFWLFALLATSGVLATRRRGAARAIPTPAPNRTVT